jgi:hypothetical protein
MRYGGPEAMAGTPIQEYLKLVPTLRQSPQGYLWSSCDHEADVLYINFKKPSPDTRRAVG